MGKPPKKTTGANITKDGQFPKSFNQQALNELAELLDQALCQDWLFNKLRPGRAGTCCPGCGAELPDRRKKTFRAFKKTQCPACRLQFTAKTNTAFFHVRLSPAEIILSAALTAAGADAAKLAEALNRGKDTAKIWQKRLKVLYIGSLTRTREKTTDETE